MPSLKPMICATAIAALPMAAHAGPGDMVNTASRVVSEVRIQNTPTAAVYYFTADGGWSAANCSGVVHSYIAENAPGAKAIIAAALASKMSGSPMTFTGICGDPAGDTTYLQIRYTIF
jgi:hypothetical protein